MLNFKIGTQIEKELAEFRTARVRLAALHQTDTVRFAVAKAAPEGYFHNQGDTIALIDLYYNSKFESGEKDKNKQRKLFMNVGKFRTDVSAKQIDLDMKDGKFIPDDYADPWTAIFLQKEFKEYGKEHDFGEEINKYVEAFPKYGSVVGKKVGNKLEFVPLQNLKNEQTAESLQTATYVIEEHPDMAIWEIQAMSKWNTEGLVMKFTDRMNVFERYGYVPLKWLKEARKEEVLEGDELRYVDAMVITGKVKDSKTDNPWHIFFAQEIKTRPYREAHWNKQHGRWLGIGVMEDQFENQQAKNIIINLARRRLHWSSKLIGQSRDTNVAMKNLVRDVADGEILEVGPEGAITTVDFASRSTGEFQQFLNEFEKNSDQKAFTYEVATGESLPSGTPFRLGVVLGNAVNSFFALKRERLALFLESAVQDFLVPQFLRDMQNQDRVLAMFADEPGFEVLKEASMNFVRNEAARITMLSGRPVDASAIEAVVQPYEEVQALFFKRDAKYYKEVGAKYSFTFSGEAEDIQAKLETLKSLFQILAQQGDPRAEKVLERIAAISGETMAQFGSKPDMTKLPPGMGGAPAGGPGGGAPVPSNVKVPAMANA
jgi:hypothetical protein